MVVTSDYAVEMYDASGFVEQLDVFDSLEAAENFRESRSESLEDGEYLIIRFINYDKNGKEIATGVIS